MKTPTTYQREIAAAVVPDVFRQRGSVFTAEMPLGSGVSELASQLEMLVMSVNVNTGGSLLRVVPQGRADLKERLVSHLRSGAMRGLWAEEPARVRLGRADAQFALSADIANVAGPFDLIQVVDAHLLRPSEASRLLEMARASNATVALYGRPWDGQTPFEQIKLANKEAGASDGARRHFRVPLERAEAELPGYAARVDMERERLGCAHPEFEASYALRPVSAGAPAFPRDRLCALFGAGGPRRLGEAEGIAASVVVTRGAGEPADAPARAVVTVASRGADGLRVLDHRWADATGLPSLVAGVRHFTEKTWACGEVLWRQRGADGEEHLRRLLEQGTGPARARWVPAAPLQRAREASAVIAATLTGRLAVYAPDGSPEHRTLRRETEWATLRRVGERGGFAIAVEGQDEGFLEGVSMLACADAEQAGEQQMAFPFAIAS